MWQSRVSRDFKREAMSTSEQIEYRYAAASLLQLKISFISFTMLVFVIIYTEEFIYLLLHSDLIETEHITVKIKC